MVWFVVIAHFFVSLLNVKGSSSVKSLKAKTAFTSAILAPTTGSKTFQLLCDCLTQHLLISHFIHSSRQFSPLYLIHDQVLATQPKLFLNLLLLISIVGSTPSFKPHYLDIFF